MPPKRKRESSKTPFQRARNAALRAAERSGLTDTPVSAANHQRNLKWQEQQEKMKAARFKGPEYSGVSYGRENDMTIPAQTVPSRYGYDEVVIPAFVGDGCIWTTLDARGGLFYRAWPDEYKRPSHVPIFLAIPPDPTEQADLAKRVARAAKVSAAFKAAEDHINSEKRITRHEAELIDQFQNCWDRAETFLEHSRQVATAHWMGATAWPEESQLAGKRKFASLQENYGLGYWPCAEAVGIAAHWYKTRRHSLPGWLRRDPTYWDAWLYLFSQKIWRATGNSKTRNTLCNLPIRPDNVVIDQASADDARKFFNRGVANVEEHMTNLANISPIAAAAIAARVRNPRQLGAKRLGQTSRLAPPTRPLFKGPLLQEWIEFFYDKRDGPVPDVPVFVPPQGLRLVETLSDSMMTLLGQVTHSLRKVAHWALIIMVWRDFILPAAKVDDAESIREIFVSLHVAVRRRSPSVLQDPNFQLPGFEDEVEGEEAVEDNEEEYGDEEDEEEDHEEDEDDEDGEDEDVGDEDDDGEDDD